MPEQFSKFFDGKITSIHSTFNSKNHIIQSSTPDEKMDFSSNALLHSFTNFSLLSTKGVSYVISNINKKNCLLDPVPVGLLSIFFNIIFPGVQSIANKSFEKACFPDQLKHAVII